MAGRPYSSHAQHQMQFPANLLLNQRHYQEITSNNIDQEETIFLSEEMPIQHFSEDVSAFHNEIVHDFSPARRDSSMENVYSTFLPQGHSQADSDASYRSSHYMDGQFAYQAMLPFDDGWNHQYSATLHYYGDTAATQTVYPNHDAVQNLLSDQLHPGVDGTISLTEPVSIGNDGLQPNKHFLRLPSAKENGVANGFYALADHAPTTESGFPSTTPQSTSIAERLLAIGGSDSTVETVSQQSGHSPIPDTCISTRNQDIEQTGVEESENDYDSEDQNEAVTPVANNAELSINSIALRYQEVLQGVDNQFAKYLRKKYVETATPDSEWADSISPRYKVEKEPYKDPLKDGTLKVAILFPDTCVNGFLNAMNNFDDIIDSEDSQEVRLIKNTPQVLKVAACKKTLVSLQNEITPSLH
jgi:hypothetical protein